MFELIVEGQAYPLHFGMGFLREINKTVSVPIDGTSGAMKNVGLKYAIAGVIDGDAEALCDVLYAANKGLEPRLTRDMIDKYIDDESTDIDALFEDVVNFLSKANATRKETLLILAAVEEAKKKEAMNQEILKTGTGN